MNPMMTDVKCWRCKGKGVLVDKAKGSTMICHSCNGTGRRMRIHKERKR